MILHIYHYTVILMGILTMNVIIAFDRILFHSIVNITVLNLATKRNLIYTPNERQQKIKERTNI